MKDLRTFVDECRRAGELKVIEDAECDLEIGTIAELYAEKHGPALLFDRIKGYERGFRVLTNVIEEPRRAALACDQSSETDAVSLVKNLKQKFGAFAPVRPKLVGTGPVLENQQRSEDVDLFAFPSPRWHEKDGGRYMGTGCIVIMKDPEGDWCNLGTYRTQVHDKSTLGIFISSGHHGNIINRKYWSKGESCPVAISFGHHPALFIASFLQRPWKESEYDVAGFLLNEPVEVLEGPETGLPIPANSEVAIEGEIPPPSVESHDEGPFGEWPGYFATGTRKEPVVRVKSLFYRKDPIILGAPPLKPPSTQGVHFFRAASVWSEIDRTGIPGIRGVYRHPAGGSKFFTVVSVQQLYPGHAKHVGMAATAGSEGGYASRYVVVVDDDINPANLEEVVWAICTRCDPKQAIDVIDGCWTTGVDPLISPEKKLRKDYTSSRAIIYACKPYNWYKEFPVVSRASDELRAAVAKKWSITT